MYSCAWCAPWNHDAEAFYVFQHILGAASIHEWPEGRRSFEGLRQAVLKSGVSEELYDRLHALAAAVFAQFACGETGPNGRTRTNPVQVTRLLLLVLLHLYKAVEMMCQCSTIVAEAIEQGLAAELEILLSRGVSTEGGLSLASFVGNTSSACSCCWPPMLPSTSPTRTA